MSLIEVKVPQLSESVAEATLLQWKKQPGQAVAIDEILIEIETDKVVLEVPAPAAGVMVEAAARTLTLSVLSPDPASSGSPKGAEPGKPPNPGTWATAAGGAPTSASRADRSAPQRARRVMGSSYG